MRASPIAVLADLEARALAGAPALPSAAGDDWEGDRFIGYRCGVTRLASPMAQVAEVLPYPVLTRVPGTKPWLKGVGHIRGRLLSAVDLSLFLGGAGLTRERAVRMLVLAHAELSIGLLVDEVLGIKRAPAAEAGSATGDAPPAEVGAGLVVETWLMPLVTERLIMEGVEWGRLDLYRVLEDPALLRVEG